MQARNWIPKIQKIKLQSSGETYYSKHCLGVTFFMMLISLSISVSMRMQLRFISVSKPFPGAIPEPPHGRVHSDTGSHPAELRNSTNIGCLPST